MPDQQKIQKAFIQEIEFLERGQVRVKGDKIPVQFNPQSLKIGYKNQKAGIGDQKGGSAIQFVGQGSTTMGVELLFDTSVSATAVGRVESVQNKTRSVIRFIKPARARNTEGDINLVPPGIRFQWGTFQFDGVVDSIDETLEYFSSAGIPLRATVSLSMSRQDVAVPRPDKGTPGITPINSVRSGESLQQAAAIQGKSNWQDIARQNGIENPRLVAAGSRLLGL